MFFFFLVFAAPWWAPEGWPSLFFFFFYNSKFVNRNHVVWNQLCSSVCLSSVGRKGVWVSCPCTQQPGRKASQRAPRLRMLCKFSHLDLIWDENVTLAPGQPLIQFEDGLWDTSLDCADIHSFIPLWVVLPHTGLRRPACLFLGAVCKEFQFMVWAGTEVGNVLGWRDALSCLSTPFSLGGKWSSLSSWEGVWCFF